MTDEEEQRLRRLYREGKSDIEIGQIMGYNKSTIQRARVRLDLPSKQRDMRVSPLDAHKEFIASMKENGASLGDIVDGLDLRGHRVSRDSLARWMNRQGIRKRPPAKVRSETIRKTKQEPPIEVPSLLCQVWIREQSE